MRWIILDCPSRPNIITKVLIRRRKEGQRRTSDDGGRGGREGGREGEVRRGRERERFEDAILLALKGP